MSIEYRTVETAVEGTTLRVCVEAVNHSGEIWRSGDGFRFGVQFIDPESHIYVEDGPRVGFDGDVAPGQAGRVCLSIRLPEIEAGHRLFLSPWLGEGGWAYQAGWRFVVLDVTMEAGCPKVTAVRTTTLRRLKAELVLRSLGRAFTYPTAGLWRNRRLIGSMVRRDLIARYRGSWGGLLWTLLNPLLLMLTYFFVFGVVLRARFEGDPSRAGFALYFLAGMLPWLAFSEAVGRAPTVMAEHRNFVKKMVFPLETLPATLVAGGLVTQAFALALFLVALALLRGGVPLSTAWLPVLLVPQILFTLGVCWFLAALGVYVRDLAQVNGFLLTVWFFLTPICYPESSLPQEALSILSKNPLYVLVKGYRSILLEPAGGVAFGPLWKLWLASALVFVAGHAWFYKLKRDFADVI
ncbi:MAG: ABC transporter permease [Bryobacteraceae bacterium]|nr:ABC transporter permease [Bryobacteraceae bacterium]